MKFGTYIFFGVAISLGAAFIYFIVPETKGLSLEEMDVLFGSVGTAQADAERMREIGREVGLDRVVHGDGDGQGRQSSTFVDGDEKGGADRKVEVV